MPTPARAGEVKPTQPTLQAAHWFAGAVSSALKLRHAHPADRVVIALPDFPRYRSLYAERADPLRLVGVEVWLVAEDGTLDTGEATGPVLPKSRVTNPRFGSTRTPRPSAGIARTRAAGARRY